MQAPRVLVTGFGPFPGVPDNISSWLVEKLESRQLQRNPDAHAHVFRTEWEEVSLAAPALLASFRPRVVLHFGVSQRARSFRIERSAYNEVEAKLDALGALPCAAAVLDDGPGRLDSKVPISALVRQLRGLGLPAVPSRSGGLYLCNLLYYLSLHWAARQERPCTVCFVHVPPGERQGGPLRDAELVAGAEAILRSLLDFAAARDAAVAGGTSRRHRHPEVRAAASLEG